MDNQQESLTQVEIGWLAGIWDGEGSISMNVRKKTWKGWHGVGVDLHMWLVNTDGRIINKAVEILTKIGLTPYLNEREPTSIFNQYNGKGKTILACGLSSMTKIHKLLSIIKPHLAGEKYGKADLIMKFIEKRKNCSKDYKHYGEEDWKIVEEFYKRYGGKAWEKVKVFLTDYTRNPQMSEVKI